MLYGTVDGERSHKRNISCALTPRGQRAHSRSETPAATAATAASCAELESAMKLVEAAAAAFVNI